MSLKVPPPPTAPPSWIWAQGKVLCPYTCSLLWMIIMLIFNWVRYDIIIDTELKPWLIEVCSYQHHKFNKAHCGWLINIVLWLCAYRLMHPLHWPTPHTVTVSWNLLWLMMSSTLCCHPLDTQSKGFCTCIYLMIRCLALRRNRWHCDSHR